MAKQQRMYGARITEAREARGLSCAELAAAVGSSTQELEGWEAETTAPSPFEAVRIADALTLPRAFFTEPPRVQNNAPIFFCRTEDKRRRLRWPRE